MINPLEFRVITIIVFFTMKVDDLEEILNGTNTACYGEDRYFINT